MNGKNLSKQMVALIGASLMSTLGCMGNTTLGDDGTGGSVAGSVSDAGSAGWQGGRGGSGGAPPAGGGGYGGSGAPVTCPATLNFDDGRSLELQSGPFNQGLLSPRMFNEAVFNYQDNIVFEGALKAGGAFMEDGGDPSLGPGSGEDLEPFLGQVELVPPLCAGTDVSGRTLTVRFLVRLTGAIGPRPEHGAFLGSAHDGEFTYYEDAVTDEDIINTLTAQTLQHTFTSEEAADVAENGVFFNLYFLESMPVDLYIDEIVWD